MKQPKQVFVTYIKTTPEKLWEAITRSQFTRQYFYGTSIESDWSPGASLIYRMPDQSLAADGKIIELERGKKLSITFRPLWNPEFAKDAAGRVTWEIEPQGAVCKLTVVHDNFPPESKVYEDVAQGWPFILSGLKTLLETGAPLPAAG
jgi:uncharacterized protein YndB with AHSA1/START domain